jgi:non-homologous end joining protein Ku
MPAANDNKSEGEWVVTFYVTLEAEELDAIKLESKKTLDLKEFIKLEEIDPRFFERPYYIVPEDEFAEEGYRVIHAALKKERRLGLGQVIMSSGRENLVAVGALESAWPGLVSAGKIPEAADQCTVGQCEV